MTNTDKIKIKELLAQGYSLRAIEKLTGVPKSTVWDYSKRLSESSEEVLEASTNPAKVLLWDCETAAMMGYVWSLWKQNVGLSQLHQHSYMLSWSAKWLGSDEIIGLTIADTEGYTPGSEDDSILVERLRNLINEADIVIAHNQNGFDKKVFNTRLLVNGLNPPKPYKSVDTLEIAKKNFKFSSNKLDGIAMQLGLVRKIDTGGFELWKGCSQGDRESFRQMLDYNMQDVEVLEEVYLRLRPWDSKHPNVTFYGSGRGCPVCGSESLVEYGTHQATARQYQAYQCGGCGHVSRSRKPLEGRVTMSNVC